MSTDVKTPYLDLHHRIIYKSARGAYFVKDAAGKKYYGVKARYVAVVNGTARKLTNKNAAPPNKIALKRVAAKKVASSPVKRSPTAILARTTLAMRLRKVTFVFSPELIHYRGGVDSQIRDKLLKWYKSMANNLNGFGEYKVLSMVPYESDKIAVSFRFTPAWAAHRAFKSMPKQIKSAMKTIIDPDDDGNHPVKVNGKEYLVYGSSPLVLSIG
jgi:hypothetical protein